MTLSEIQTWIQNAKRIDVTYDDYDECGNHHVGEIYEKDGNFFRIEFSNGHPCERWNHKGGGFIRGEYDITPVKKATRQVTITEWRLVG